MGRRSYVEQLIAGLRLMPSHQASSRVLAGQLGWSVDRVKSVVERAERERPGHVHIGKGDIVKYRGPGIERGSTNPLYREVGRVITAHWGPKTLGLRDVAVLHTATSGRRDGRIWTHPDLVVAAFPRRRSSSNEPRRLHAIEVEARSGFDVRSVYQAHAQGWGANYTWVFGGASPDTDHRDMSRIVRTATELNVGLVVFQKAESYGTWRTLVEPAHHEPRPGERSDFIATAIGPALATKHHVR